MKLSLGKGFRALAIHAKSMNGTLSIGNLCGALSATTNPKSFRICTKYVHICELSQAQALKKYTLSPLGSMRSCIQINGFFSSKKFFRTCYRNYRNRQGDELWAETKGRSFAFCPLYPNTSIICGGVIS